MLAEILSSAENFFSQVCLYDLFCFMSGFIFFVLFVACVLYMHVVVVQDVCSWCVHVYGECGCMFCIAFAC